MKGHALERKLVQVYWSLPVQKTVISSQIPTKSFSGSQLELLIPVPLLWYVPQESFTSAATREIIMNLDIEV
jgi:hypothetical protein